MNATVIAPALLTDDQAAHVYGISVRRFHELRTSPGSVLPAPVCLGPRLLRWPLAELIEAIGKLPRQEKPAAEPLQLRKSRAAAAGTTAVSQ